MASFLVGNSVEITASFADIAGTLIDPTTVTLRINGPTGPTIVVTYASGAITRVSTGMYQYIFNPSVGGTWTYRWEGTGTLPVAKEGTFDIQSSTFVPGS